MPKTVEERPAATFDDPVLTLEEAAEQLRRTPRALRDLARAGRIGYLADRPIRFRRSHLVDYMTRLDRQPVTTPPPPAPTERAAVLRAQQDANLRRRRPRAAA